MQRTSGGKGGYLLPMAIIFILISVIVGMTILAIGGQERIAAGRRLYHEQAFYAADAGIAYAYAQIKNAPDWMPVPNPSSPVAVGAGSFTVAVDRTQADTPVVTAVGTVHGQSETVVLTLAGSGGGAGGAGGSFAQGVFGNTSLSLSNNAVVDSYDSTLGPYGGSNVGQNAYVGSRQIINLSNNAVVNGNAYVTGPGGINLGNGAVITGSQNYNYSFNEPLDSSPLPPVTIPTTLSSLAYPVQGDSRISGSYTLSNGRLTLSNNATATITVPSGGNGNFNFQRIVLSNGSRLNVVGATKFYVQSILTLSNNSRMQWSSSSSCVMYLGTSCAATFANNSILSNLSGNPANMQIYSASSNTLTFSNNAQALSMVLYAPNASVILSNNAQAYGGIVANNLILANNALFHYDTALRTTSLPDDPNNGSGAGEGTVSYNAVRWQKPGWQNRFH